MLLATGALNLDKGLPGEAVPVPDGDILSLHARVQSVRILSADGPHTVFGGPKTVELLDLSAVAALLSTTTAPAGTYSGVELIITQGTLVLADNPLDPIELELAENGVYTIDFAFEIAPDSSGLLYLELGGLNVFLQDDDSYLLAPEASAALRQSVANARLEGTIESIDTANETLVLAAGSASFAVDFDGAEIFVPGDYGTPTGTPASLVPESRVALIGTVGGQDSMAPDTIEVLDLPGTPSNEEGDLVTLCYLYGDDPVWATTIEVLRSRLDFVLDRGGFEGSCEGGDPFTLTYAAGPGGSIGGETPQSVLPSADGAAVTAVPDEGFAFVNWSDGSTINPRTDTAVGADLSVTANFTSLFALTYTAGVGGTLAGNTNQLVPEGGNGSPVTAVRSDGFMFDQWSDGSTDNPRTDLNVTEDITVTANFLRIYSLTYNATAGGTLEGNMSQSIVQGEDGTPVTAIPGEGFVFGGWSDGNTDNPRTDVNVDANLSVTANFLAQFTLTYAAGANGALTGETTQIVNAGSAGTAVTAVGADGFGFAGWSDGRTDNPRIDTNVQGNVSVTATFATSVFLTYTAGPNGTLTGESEQEIGSGGSSSAVTAVPNEGFAFDRWSDGRTVNPRVDQNVLSNLSVTAEFVPAFTLTYTAGANGSLTGNTTQVVKEGGSGTSVTAVPDTGFVFRGWSDGGTQNPRTDQNVTADLDLTAEFIQVFVLNYTAGTNGTITGPRAQTIRLGSDGRTVTAVPNDGFGFIGWSDGSIENPRTDLDITAALNVTANFAAQVTLTFVAGEHGAVTGNLVQEVAVGDDSTPVTAVPDENYIFLQWSDGSTQNPRTDTDVNSTLNLTAFFFETVEMVSVSAGVFTMGARDDGDDGTFGSDDELPRRDVTLDAYQIGKFEVTNAEFSVFMNYLVHPSRNQLRRQNGNVWSAHNEHIWFTDSAQPKMIFAYSLTEDGIDFDSTSRTFVSKRLAGLPEGTVHDKADHPVTEPTWYGAVLYANFLSERSGLEPVYDVDTWEADFTKNGYRLPTEAEWERAAAWDGEKHWIYPFSSDVLNTRDRANFHDGGYMGPPDLNNPNFINPLGIVQDAKESYTSPVGWFNGINVSPNGNIQTVDSPSSVGCYDMAGNVVEWCHDWYSATYYGENVVDNPVGPDSGEKRVARGGAWARLVNPANQRSARRYAYEPNFSDGINGFRLAR